MLLLSSKRPLPALPRLVGDPTPQATAGQDGQGLLNLAQYRGVEYLVTVIKAVIFFWCNQPFGVVMLPIIHTLDRHDNDIPKQCAEDKTKKFEVL